MTLVNVLVVIDHLSLCRQQIIVVVDNTFLSSYFQRPLELGADIAMYSLTKYMNGHSDVIMGAAIVNDEEIHNRLRYLQNGECGMNDL